MNEPRFELSQDTLYEELWRLRKENSNLNEALKLSPMALCHQDKKLRYTWLRNPHLGFDTAAVIGKTDWDLVDKEVADMMAEVKYRVLKTGVGERVEIPSEPHKKLNSEYFELCVEPLKDHDSQAIIGVSCSGLDVTADRRLREAYRAKNKNLDFIFNASPMPIVVVDCDSDEIVFFNQSAEKLFMLGQWRDQSQGFLLTLNMQSMLEELVEGNDIVDYPIEFDVNRIVGDGIGESERVHRHLSVSASHIYYDGSPAILTTYHDMTRQLEIEQSLRSVNEQLEGRVAERTRDLMASNRELKSQKEKAESSSRAKSDFLSKMSHEIRTPMNGILGMLQLLENTEIEPSQRRYVKTALQSGRELLLLINDLLDFSKIESGSMTLSQEAFSVRDLVGHICEVLSVQASSKKLRLSWFFEQDVPAYVVSDRNRVRQVLFNLVGNAIKFTEEGYVSITVSVQQKNGVDELHFEVLDSGVGIPNELQDSVFESFVQADNTMTRQFEGTGLGLSICQQLITLLEGRIGVNSEVGVGSQFWFNVPLKIAERASDINESDPALETLNGEAIVVAENQVVTQSPMTILIAEDNRTNQFVIEKMLEDMGHTVVITENGIDALTALESQRFDIAFMDCRMPMLDGYTATKYIRKQELPSEHLPIIAMTANAGEAEEESCRLAGMDDFMSKPVEMKSLIAMLNKWQQKINIEEIQAFEQSGLEKSTDADESSDNTAIVSAVDIYREEIPELLGMLKMALRDSNHIEIGECLHAIRGASLNVKAEQVAEMCADMEIADQHIGTLFGKLETLEVLVSNFLSEVIAAPEEIHSTDNLAKQHILIVDDNRTNRAYLQGILERGRYFINEAENGLEAIELCKTAMPDLILMDAMMPKMDGFTACEEILKIQNVVKPCVLVVTALQDEASIEKAFHAGATDFIPKPVNLMVLRNRIENLLKTRQSEQHIHELAYFDSLTHLPNRAQFMSLAETQLQESRSKGLGSALLFLDLDRFKMVNDSLGHDAGDLMLETAAIRLKSCLRSCDLVARLGGDEFTIMIDSLKDESAVSQIADKICKAMAEPFSFSHQMVYVSVSIGIAVHCHEDQDIQELMKHADIAMFKAKSEGGNCYQFYELGMETEISQKVKLEGELRTALKNDELVLHYQPQCDLENNELIGFEALVRWQHPERGLLAPGLFIPVAEECGLITELGNWVLREACQQQAAWRRQYQHTIPVAVNVASRQLASGELYERVSNILAETKIDPEMLKLELTEDSLFNVNDRLIEQMHKIRELGVHLEIDDFGTGYSSLSYLKSFPLTTLKIDRSFVIDLAENNENAAIVSSIVTLAHNLNMSVLAEGVETADQAELLRAQNCDSMQGYFLSKPLPPDQLVDWFSSV